MMKNIFILLIFILAPNIAYSQETNNDEDLYSISYGQVDNPDIVCSRSIPIVNEKITIAARVRGKGQHPVSVQFVLSASDIFEVTLEAKLGDHVNGEYAEYFADWTPSQAASYNLTVKVDSDNKSEDKVKNNNSYTTIIPVVWRELHIIPWSTTKQMKWITCVSCEIPKGKDEISELDYWHRRGIKPLGFMYTVERELMQLSKEQMINSIFSKAEKYAKAGAEGLIIDEIGSYGTPDGFEFIQRFGAAYDKIHKEYPHLKTYSWIAGPVHREEIETGIRNNHIMMGECYEAIHARKGPVWRARIENYINKLGQNNIIALGISGDCGRPFKPLIENSVRIIREIGPDMPGICYYSIEHISKEKSHDLQQFLDKLTFDYFIKPVLTVSKIEQCSNKPIKPGDTVEIQTEIRNIGGMPAKNALVKLYARNIKTRRRTFLSEKTLSEIGNGTIDIIEDNTDSSSEKEINGIIHPIGRFGKTTRIVLDRAVLYTKWTPEQEGNYAIEAEIYPSGNFTILTGFLQKELNVSTEEPVLKPLVSVTEDDIWLSNYTPSVNEEVSIQVCIHNEGNAPADSLSVDVYVYYTAANRRTWLNNTTIKRIGVGSETIQEDDVSIKDYKIVEGTKHPIVQLCNTTKIFYSKALVNATWIPDKAGYYRIRVAIQPSKKYEIRQSEATKDIPVKE
ncbi:MAG: CARDB domain-containing protein [Planctomycetota bacterium]